MTDSRKPAFGFWARSILVVGLLLVVLSFFGDEALGSRIERGLIVGNMRNPEHVSVSNSSDNMQHSVAGSDCFNNFPFHYFSEGRKREWVTASCPEHNRNSLWRAGSIDSRNVQVEVKLNFVGPRGPVISNMQKDAGGFTERKPVSHLNFSQQYVGSLSQFYSSLLIVRASLGGVGTFSGIYSSLSHLGSLTPHAESLPSQNFERAYRKDYIHPRESDIDNSQNSHDDFRFGKPPLEISTAFILLGLGFAIWCWWVTRFMVCGEWNRVLLCIGTGFGSLLLIFAGSLVLWGNLGMDWLN
jgi:hypothetical protein